LLEGLEEFMKRNYKCNLLKSILNTSQLLNILLVNIFNIPYIFLTDSLPNKRHLNFFYFYNLIHMLDLFKGNIIIYSFSSSIKLYAR